MSDGMDFGNEQREECEPLTPQEHNILRSMGETLDKAQTAFARWLRGFGNQVPRQTIRFTATVTGDALKEMRYLNDVVVDGGHFISRQRLAAEIVTLGIRAVHHKLMSERVGRMIRAIAVLRSSPPEMAETVITKELREDIRAFVANMAEDNPLPDVTAEEPEAVSPETAVKPPAVPVAASEEATPPVTPPAANEPACGEVDGEEPPVPADAKCAHCGNRVPVNDRVFFKHAGAKKRGWMHHDCAIDAWKELKQ